MVKPSRDADSSVYPGRPASSDALSASEAAWTAVPGTAVEIESVARACRQTVSRHAMLAAGVAAIPIPGIDWVTDIGILLKLIPQINSAFGLSPEQVERLAPDRQVVVYKAITASGGLLIGKLVTRELLIKALQIVGVRLTTQQAAKFVPIAGQAVSAALTYSALRYVCEQHIRQCMVVAQQVNVPRAVELVQRVDAGLPRSPGVQRPG
jgi:uncharacterized protein (DUF697 family)